MTYRLQHRRAGRVVPTPPTISGVPTIVGTPTEGVTPSAVPASVSGTGPITTTIHWMLDGVDQGMSYVPAAGTAGHTLAPRQISSSSYGTATADGSGATIAAASASAPQFSTDFFAGRPVVLGVPKVGNQLTVLSPQLAVPGNPSPSVSIEWWAGEDGLDGALIGTGSVSPTLLNDWVMQEVYVKYTLSNASGTIMAKSYRARVMPASWTYGAPTDDGNTSDPASGVQWDPAVLYKGGRVVYKAGAPTVKYICIQPYAYNKDPATATGYWGQVSNVYYIDPDNGDDNNYDGTSPTISGGVGPWKTYDAIRKKVTANTTGYSAAPAGSLFLFKRNSSMPFAVTIGSTANKPFYFGNYGSGALPQWHYTTLPQAQISAFGQPSGCLICNNSQQYSHRVFGIALYGDNLVYTKYTNLSGTLNVGDTLSAKWTPATAPQGADLNAVIWTGTVKATFTSLSTNYVVLENLESQGTFTYAVDVTDTTSTATFQIANDQNAPVFPQGIASFGNGNYGFGAIGCEFHQFTGIAFLAAANASITNGDHVLAFNYISHCATKTVNGAGADGDYGPRSKVWFNEIYDCGSPGSARCHNLYMTNGVMSSIIGNKSWHDGNYGGSGVVIHGNVNSSGGAALSDYKGGFEIAYNWFKGTRVGIALNNGYATAEAMFGFNVHHNLVDSIGQNGNSSLAVGWDIDILNDSRIHNNVTTNSLSASFYEHRNDSGTGDVYMANVAITQNTWYNTPVYIGSNADGTLASNITKLRFLNNIFDGSTAINVFCKGSTMQDAQLTLNGNLYYGQGAANTIQWNYAGGLTYTGYVSAAALAAATSNQFDASNGVGDPAFTSPSTNDFSLGGASPARNQGVECRYYAGASNDFVGVSRTTATPHIGAYQTA